MSRLSNLGDRSLLLMTSGFLASLAPFMFFWGVHEGMTRRMKCTEPLSYVGDAPSRESR